MLQSVMSCYVVLCHVVLCYGQSAQTFYMCLESLVGCMKENVDSFTYFRLMEWFYEVSLSTFGPSTLSQRVNAFLKSFWCRFETHVEALSKQFQGNVWRALWSNSGIILKLFRCHVWRNVKEFRSKLKAMFETTLT